MKIVAKTLTVLMLATAATVGIAATVVANSDHFDNSAVVEKAKHAVEQGVQVTRTAVPAAVNQVVNPQAVVDNGVINQNAISAPMVNVQQALKLADDSHVQIKGYVVKALGDEKYQFRDSSGSMTVDIDDELWAGQAVSATTLLTIEGEVDVDYKPMKRIEIDVDAVRF